MKRITTDKIYFSSIVFKGKYSISVIRLYNYCFWFITIMGKLKIWTPEVIYFLSRRINFSLKLVHNISAKNGRKLQKNSRKTVTRDPIFSADKGFHCFK